MKLTHLIIKQLIITILSAVLIGGYVAGLFFDTFYIWTFLKICSVSFVIIGLGMFTLTKELITSQLSMNENENENVEENIEEEKIKFYYFPYAHGRCIVMKRETMSDGTISDLYSYKDENGNFITTDWFDDAGDFIEEGIATVVKDGKYNIINKDGEILCNEWYIGMHPFHDGYAKVFNDEYATNANFINTSGKLMWDTWESESLELFEYLSDKLNNN